MNIGSHRSRVGQFPADNHSGSSNQATLQKNPWQGHWVRFPSESLSQWHRPAPRRAQLLPCARPEPAPSRASLHSRRGPHLIASPPRLLLKGIAPTHKTNSVQVRNSRFEVLATKSFPELRVNCLQARRHPTQPDPYRFYNRLLESLPRKSVGLTWGNKSVYTELVPTFRNFDFPVGRMSTYQLTR